MDVKDINIINVFLDILNLCVMAVILFISIPSSPAGFQLGNLGRQVLQHLAACFFRINATIPQISTKILLSNPITTRVHGYTHSRGSNKILGTSWPEREDKHRNTGS